MEKFNLKKRIVNLSVLVLICLLLCKNQSFSQPTIYFKSVISSGLNSPIQLVNAGDGTNRIFIVEKGGTIKVFNSAFTSLGTFLTVDGVLNSGEQGLLSMAFHPDYETNGTFFVYYNNLDGNLEIARYKVNPGNANLANEGSKTIVKTILHPDQPNHNGGELHFGSDGYLYLSIGDGGGGDDPNNNAQNPTRLLGKILRIAVNTTDVGPIYTNPADNPYPDGNGGKNEVFATGLRNPFRWSFDSGTGDMWIGDVGQGAREEINHRTAATLSAANYGWGCYEGTLTHNNADCIPNAQYHFPIHEYVTNSAAGNSVVGGVVYRGTLHPEMQGYYIGGDFKSGNLHIIGPVSGTITTTVRTSTITDVADFGEAENGEIYAVALTSGAVYNLTPQNPLPVDLISFTGVSGNEGVRLNWKTAMEKDFRQFDVEYSTNAKSFSQVGSVYPKNSVTGSEYQFFHSVNSAQTLYYRLKMVDQDDSFKYSTIISIDSGNENVSANFVRPSLIDSKMMHLLIEEPFNSFELVSANGNVLMRKDITNESGDLNIPVESVSSGMYIVRLQGNERILNQKVLIVK
ncbi:PQQ-dependent sugar dehydrogenase [Dyadobacter subterraneus]|uniref:PQQ-dependent sugar dehydrogenase n=1 Tax=Dyadobacter subterraneus TaxID=2773304 RepID=A0ABR9WPL4_9BACT|nr:PQQ-dependent sugar dehydrogenase [Dyadobacter subterraneus]MBE9466296.1 PQQ-dependent sugar dehydrogenase [Dyadobacter subterraneus]